ncbi:MAG: hypothetical protein QM621_11760 [Aeromicrobium sp.]|uniref:hypothetical protein n=1 Tax=Aeromicrobium sp. TaxID=1871063 RepID=UPI0039E5AC3C
MNLNFVRILTFLLLPVFVSACGGSELSSENKNSPTGGGAADTVDKSPVEIFCDTHDEYKDRYLEAVEASRSQGGLVGLLGTASAIGDLSLMWQELAEVAPGEISADVERVRDGWAAQEENAISGDLSAGLATAIFYSGSMGRIDLYIRQNGDNTEALPNNPVTPGLIFLDLSTSSANLYIVDPEEGTVTPGPSFAITETAAPLVMYAIKNAESSVSYRSLFSPDYSLMAASGYPEEGSLNKTPVGWIDSQGNFTNVSVTTGPEESFSSTYSDSLPAFDPSGNFWFGRETSNDSLWVEALQPYRHDPRFGETVSVGPPVNPAYTIVPGGEPLENGYYPFFAESFDGEMGCWGANSVRNGVCVGGGDGELPLCEIYSINEDTSKFIAPTGRTASCPSIVPETDLGVRRPVLSPDSKQVAFTTEQPNNESEQRLFRVSAKGGQPVLVETSQPILDSYILIDWHG